MSYTTYSPKIGPLENGYNTSWYDECNCCPYGYHIDLDFVRYCESISKDAENRTGSFKRRKDRRRTRQSMEVLLGLTPPVLAVLDNVYKPSHRTLQESPRIVPKQTAAQTGDFHFDSRDGFDDAVSDFERTLQRSKNKLSHNLPDVTAVSENLRRVPSISSVSSASGSMTVLPSSQDGLTRTTEFDTVSVESCLSPIALHNIREALALSLKRTKNLEHQVLLLPQLQEELSELKRENKQLNEKLKSEEALRVDLIHEQRIQTSSPSRKRATSYTHINFDSDIIDKKEPFPIPSKKDFGVMCGVLTRNIGVGHQNPSTKQVGTTTDFEFADKWLPEKAKFMNSQHMSLIKTVTISKGTQTLFVKEKRDVSTQSAQEKIQKKILLNSFCQTTDTKPDVVNVSVMAKARLHDICIQKNVECYSVGSSDDTVNNIICEKCNALKVSVGVGPGKTEDHHTTPVSLSNLGSRSKSFNLGGDSLDFHKRTRSVASQYELFNNISRSCQSDSVKKISRFSQHETKYAEKTVQSEIESTSKTTDTKDLRTSVQHVAVGVKPKTTDIGSNTLPLEIKSTKTKDIASNTLLPNTSDKAINTKPTTLDLYMEEKSCSKCTAREKEPIEFKEFKKSDAGGPSPSRIPVPTTPIEARKFRRQDTYTKIYSSSPPDRLEELSGLDFSTKAISAESISPFDKVKENLKSESSPRVESLTELETTRLENKERLESPTSSSKSNGVTFAPITKVQIHEVSLPVSESTIFQHNSQNRKKAAPSKEMQGAMKVLNDSLLKNVSKPVKNQSAVNIVQSEWFKMSSLVTANPLDVEDYLDAFEDMSSQLLEYVVNLTDASGNTAMHYAVSHGNFDVVSILLDSKVCDINKPNKAGYTCVMLVSLAEVRSKTHANVVRRLFQLADVNVRAKQHGQTALMLAVSHGRLDMVKMLLEAGADINIRDEDGSTALMCAAEHGHIDIVKHFLSHPDCDSSITDVDGSTALKIAMEAGHRHIGVLLYAHERNYQKSHRPLKLKKTKSNSPKTPSSPLPIRSSHRALTDTDK